MSNNTKGDCEAWSVVVQHMLYLAEPDQRIAILELAMAAERKEADNRAKNGGLIFMDKASMDEFMASPYMRWHGRFQRYQAATVYCFARELANNNSPEDAAKLLFGPQRHGGGSGYLADYIDDLPRKVGAPHE